MLKTEDDEQKEHNSNTRRQTSKTRDQHIFAGRIRLIGRSSGHVDFVIMWPVLTVSATQDCVAEYPDILTYLYIYI